MVPASTVLSAAGLSFAPAFGGLPGGMELFVVALIFLLLSVPVLLVLVGLGWFASRGSGGPSQERVDELEDEVADLKRRLEEREADQREASGGSNGERREP